MAKQLKKYECTSCGEEYEETEFPKNYSDIYKFRTRVTVCKPCLEKLYIKLLDRVKDGKVAMYYLCRHFDWYYSENLYEGSEKQSAIKGASIVPLYIQKLGSLPQYKHKRFEHSDDIGIKSSEIKNPIFADLEDDFVLTKEIVKRWGKGLEVDEYQQLEEFFQSMVISCGCEDPIKENILKNLSHTQLEANKARASGRIQDYDKLMSSMSKMMKDGGVTPSNKINDNDEKAMIGMWTKMIEEEEPIPETLPIFKDIDKIGHYIKTWFIQHFARVFGLINDNEVQYDKPPKRGDK